jgi:hypothetical protein
MIRDYPRRLSITNIIRSDDDYYAETKRHDASVLNAESPSDEADHFFVENLVGNAIIEHVDRFAYVLEEKLADYTIVILGKVRHEIKNEPQEFDGWFIGEEHYGMTNPILLLHSGRVFQHDSIHNHPDRFIKA